MLYFDLLPMVRRPDMGVGGECEVYLLQPSLQEASMPASELDTGGEYEAHSQQSSSHKASMPVNELETGGDHEVKLHQSSIQKDSMPANESEDAVMTDQAPIGEQDQAQTSGGTSELQVVIFRSLRSADRLQQKTVKDGKPSIKGHGMTADDSVVRLQDCQNELKDNTAKLAASKKDLKKIKGQLHSKKKDLTACKRKLKASKGSGRDLKAKIKSLQDSLTVAQENLTKCKDDLFSLQTMTRIPDSLILDSFESLSQQIVQWIDAEVATFEKAHPEAKPDHVFSLGEDKFATAFLRDHPSAGEHLARFLIHRFSLVNVFWKTVSFFGLPEETAQLLWNAELRMAELDPPRDAVAIASWRSETLRALAKTTECTNYGNKQAQDLNSRLFKELSRALPLIFSSQEAHITFYNQVLLPAVRLANTIRMSTSDYVFPIPKSRGTKVKPAIKDFLEVHKMVDSKSGRQLKPDSAVVADKDGSIGKIIICLEPGLHRVVKGKETTLRPAMYLVELNHPLGKRSKVSA